MDIIIRLAVLQYMVTQAVMKCPMTIADWNISSMALQCKKPNYYHCLRDESGNIAQQCLERVWIQNGMCPEYNSKAQRIDVYDCKSHQNNCPTATFWSNAVYVYPGCFSTSDATSTASQPAM
ncbi:uncharacterized protein LOC133187232 [Saccostrea echinata]|uniref:uncharacterized protein LOC133187232 n=1 Tax=Saccostrea echinata TaxID=191078 RepID=UPI002A826503|nr:uncharacterized protein LOC133187232 [Saccostrea echinata]